jgi:hypothetical protein
MSFGGSPQPMAAVPAPAPPPALTPMSPTTQKPPRKGVAPSFLSEALAPTGTQAGGRSLIGGAPTALGA